jgi:cysteine desulfurase / selenocysteine lyase
MTEAGEWSAFQALFAGLDEVTWLNHAGVSPVSRPVADAMHQFIEELVHRGALGVPDWYAGIKEAKRLVAPLLNCNPADLAVTSNTTHGINLVANGIRWESGDEVLLCSKEYPANVYPWWAQQAKGVRLVWVHPSEDGRIPVETYARGVSKRTRVIAVSHVQFASGYRHDLSALGRLAKEAGALFVVDAIQSFPVFPIDVVGWGIDALSTGTHKWLLGPTGVAFFFTTPALRESLDTTWVGADCMVDSLNYLDYRFELLPDGRRFENACMNFAGIAGARAALEVVTRFGRERIEEAIKRRTGQLQGFFESMGFTIHSSRQSEEWSGILSVTHPRISPGDLEKRLRAEGMITSVRDGCWRLSPHAYHTDAQFDRILNAIAKVE